jgi:hypothetical protein
MMAHVRGAPLIYSVLLGALVISCASPPVYVVAPAPAAAPAPAPQDAPAPPGGLQGEVQEAQPPPAPQAIPGPAVPPAQAPVVPPKAAPVPAVPPGRPGGAPPGTELVTVPGGAGTDLDEWLANLSRECGKTNSGPTCLKLDIDYKDLDGNKLHKGGTYTNCVVQSQNPDMNARAPVGSIVHLKVNHCVRPTDTSGGSNGGGTGGSAGTTTGGGGTGGSAGTTTNSKTTRDGSGKDRHSK